MGTFGVNLNFDFGNLKMDKLLEDALKSGKADLSSVQKDIKSNYQVTEANKGLSNSGGVETVDLMADVKGSRPSAGSQVTGTTGETPINTSNNVNGSPETNFAENSTGSSNGQSNMFSQNQGSGFRDNNSIGVDTAGKSSTSNGSNIGIDGSLKSGSSENVTTSSNGMNIGQETGSAKGNINTDGNALGNNKTVFQGNSTNGSNGNAGNGVNLAGNNVQTGSSSNDNSVGISLDMEMNQTSSAGGDSNGRDGKVYVTSTNNDYGFVSESVNLDEYSKMLSSYGLRGKDINRVVSGQILIEDLLGEIQNDSSNLRRKEIMEASYLHAFGLEISSMNELNRNIKSTKTEISKLINKKSKADLHEMEAIINIIVNLKMGATLEDVLSEENVAWKYVDKYGNTCYKYERPMDLEYEAGVDLKSVVSLKFEDMYKDSSLLGELKDLLKDGKWNSNDLSEKFFEELVKKQDEFSNQMSGDLYTIDQDIKELETTLSKYENIYSSIEEEVTYYMDNIDVYINKPDFEKNNKFNENCLNQINTIKENMKNRKGQNLTAVPIILLKKNELVDAIACMINGKEDLSGGCLDTGTVTVRFTSDDSLFSNYQSWAKFVTDVEKNIFNYIYNTEGKDAAYDYLQGMADELDKRWLANKTQEDETYAKEHPFVSSFASILVTPIEGLSAACYSLNARIRDEKIRRKDVYSAGDIWRGAVAQDIAKNYGDGWSFAYSTGMSMADSVSLIGVSALTGGTATPVLSATLMGSRAYVSTLNDALDRGLSDGAAVSLAFSSAVVETVMESYSVGHLLDLETKLGKNTTKLVSKIADSISNEKLASIATKSTYIAASALSQGLAEGEEEFATEILNTVFDEIISGDLSNQTLTINSYIESGMSEDEARVQAGKDFGSQLGQAFLGGFVSGICFGTFGGVKTTYTVSKNIAHDMYAQFEGTKAQKFAAGVEMARLQQEAYVKADGKVKNNVDLTIDRAPLLQNENVGMQSGKEIIANVFKNSSIEDIELSKIQEEVVDQVKTDFDIESVNPSIEKIVDSKNLNSDPVMVELDQLLNSEDPNDAFQYVRNHSENTDLFFKFDSFNSWFNELFPQNTALFTRAILNNVKDQYTMTKVLNQINNLSEEEFGEFWRSSGNLDLLASDVVQSRIINSSKLLENLKTEDIYSYVHRLEDVCPENVQTFMDKTDFDLRSFEDKIEILASVNLPDQIQSKVLDNFSGDELCNLLQNDSWHFGRIVEKLSVNNFKQTIEKMNLEELSLKSKLNLISLTTDSELQKYIIDNTNLTDYVLEISIYDCKRLLQSIKNPDNAYEIFEAKYNSLASESDQRDLLENLSLFNSELQFNFIVSKNVLSSLKDSYTFEKLFDVLDANVCDKLIQNNLSTMYNWTMNTLATLYFKTKSEDVLLELKNRIGRKGFQPELYFCDRIIDNHMETLFSEEEITKIFNGQSIKNLIDYMDRVQDVNVRNIIRAIFDENLKTSTNFDIKTLALVKDRLSEERVNSIIDSMQTWNINLSDISENVETFSTEQVTMILDKLDVNSLITHADKSFVHDYLYKKLSDNPSLTNSISSEAISYFNKLSTDLLELVTPEEKMKLLNFTCLDDESFKEDIRNLILENKPLIENVSVSALKNVLEIFSEEERIELIDIISAEKLASLDFDSFNEKEVNLMKKKVVDTFENISARAQTKLFGQLDVDEQLNLLNKIDSIKYSSLSSSSILNAAKSEQCLELVYKKLSFETEILNPLQDFVQKLDNQEFNRFIKCCSSKNLLAVFEISSRAGIEAEIMNRFDSDKSIFRLDVEGLSIMKLSSESQEVLNNYIKESLSGVGAESLIDNASLFDKMRLTYAFLDGLLDSDKIKLLTTIKVKNPFVLETVNYKIFDDSIYSLGEKFVSKLSKYYDVVEDMFKLKEDITKFNLFVDSIKYDSESSTLVSDQKMAVILDYLLKNDLAEKFADLSIEEINIARNIILRESNYFSKTSLSLQRSRIEVDFDNLSEYYSRLDQKCDSLIQDATSEFEVQNLIFNKYFSISIEEANELFRLYGSKYTLVKDLDTTGIATTFLENLHNILEAKDINELRDIYNTFSADNRYTLDDLISIENEIKKIYTRSLKQTLYNPENVDGYIEFEGEKIPYYIPKADFQMLIQSTKTDYGGLPVINDNYSDSWNLSRRTSNHGVCCSLISNNSLSMANVIGDGIIIGFNEFSDEQINLMAPYDIYTGNDSYLITCQRAPLYLPGSEVMNETRHTHNEFNLERANLTGTGKFGNIQPNYVVVFEEMSEELKTNAYKACRDFNIPLIVLNKESIAQQESLKIDDLINQYNETKNLDFVRDALVLHENNRTGFLEASKELAPKYFPTERIQALLETAIQNIDNVDDLLYLEDILVAESLKFDTTLETVGRIHQADINIDDLIYKIDKMILPKIEYNDSLSKIMKMKLMAKDAVPYDRSLLLEEINKKFKVVTTNTPPTIVINDAFQYYLNVVSDTLTDAEKQFALDKDYCKKINEFCISKIITSEMDLSYSQFETLIKYVNVDNVLVQNYIKNYAENHPSVKATDRIQFLFQ